MAGHITPEDAARFRARWRLLRAQKHEELARTSPEAKLRQLAALMGAIDALGWRESLQEEDRLSHERWSALRERYRK